MKKGLTLIELLISITLISIMFSLVFSKLEIFNEKNKTIQILNLKNYLIDNFSENLNKIDVFCLENKKCFIVDNENIIDNFIIKYNINEYILNNKELLKKEKYFNKFFNKNKITFSISFFDRYFINETFFEFNNKFYILNNYDNNILTFNSEKELINFKKEQLEKIKDIF